MTQNKTDIGELAEQLAEHTVDWKEHLQARNEELRALLEARDD